ncbi:MAG: M23 family metallopeptidase [Dethiobacteria bacterium]|jgi:murein DD-endopeptidase MepM/ murein hydrolase activator NlpD|nr:peptidoglycan DD-metalloendopeptidase family protein [Bacillota bacterium]
MSGLGKKKSRAFTIMFVPHTDEATYSIRISLIFCQFLSVFVILFIAVLLVFGNSYLNLRAQMDELKHLRQISRIQKEELDVLAQQTEEMLQQVSEVERLSDEVRRLIESQELAAEHGSEGGVSSPRVLSSRTGNEIINRTTANILALRDSLTNKADELESLIADVEEYQRRLAATPSIWPAYGRITSGFGTRRSPFNRYRIEFHEGIDIAAPLGSPIYATADGKVVVSAYRSGWGNLVRLDHGYGYQTVYAHMSRRAVKPGDSVKKGEIIGYIGSTGYSTGPHVHYEVHVRGVAVDPMDYL